MFKIGIDTDIAIEIAFTPNEDESLLLLRVYYTYKSSKITIKHTNSKKTVIKNEKIVLNFYYLFENFKFSQLISVGSGA